MSHDNSQGWYSESSLMSFLGLSININLANSWHQAWPLVKQCGLVHYFLPSCYLAIFTVRLRFREFCKVMSIYILFLTVLLTVIQNFMHLCLLLSDGHTEHLLQNSIIYMICTSVNINRRAVSLGYRLLAHGTRLPMDCKKRLCLFMRAC